MVGFVGAAKQERAAGEALATVREAKTTPAKQPLDYASSTPSWVAQQPRSAHFLSAPRRRVQRVLQKHLLLQLVANKRGADIDPRRRPPHAATPESILARWIAADPKRLVAGVLALGLHAASPSAVTGSTLGASQLLSSSSVAVVEGESTSHRTSAAAAAVLDTTVSLAPGAVEREYQGPQGIAAATVAARAAVAGDPFEACTTCSTTTSITSSTAPSTIESSNSNNSAKNSSSNRSKLSKKVYGGSVRDRSAESAQSAEEAVSGAAKRESPEGGGGGESSDALLTSCVLCLSPFSSIGGSFLCCACLHTLKSNQRPCTVESIGGSNASCSLSSFHSSYLKSTVGSHDIVEPCSAHRALQDQLEVEVHPSIQTVMRQPKRSFKRPASIVSAALQQPKQEENQQNRGQQQQDGCGGFFDGSDEAKEGIGWRARAAAAAAAAEDSSWWSSACSGGEPLVVPPLLLPLLPSIFCLHARPWPPPPTKRRRLLFRRRRGLDCFVAPAVAAQRPMWGSGLAQKEGGQQAWLPNTAAPGAEAEAICPDQFQLTATPEAANAAHVAAEQPAEKGPHAGDDLGKAANDAAAVGRMASSFCSYQCCCPPWITRGTDKPAEQPAASGLVKGCYWCSPAWRRQSQDHEVQLRKRRERQSEPSFRNTAAATAAVSAPTAAVVCAAAAVRDMAAAAAAATFTGQQKHEQRTPPPRFRRMSWSEEVSRSAAATTGRLPTATPAVVTRISAATEGVESSQQCSGCKLSTSKATAAAELASGQAGAAREPLAGVAAGARAAVAAGARAAVAATAAAAAASAAGSFAPSLRGCISPRPASREEAAASCACSGAEEVLREAADDEGLEKGSADVGLGKGVDEKSLGKGLEGKTLDMTTSGKGVGKGPNRGLDRGQGGGNGGSGGCVRYGSLARISQGLLVGGSSLGRGSGLGIYTCRSFSRRAVICEYSGILIDRRTALLLRHMECASHVVNVQMQHLYLLGFHTPFPLLGGGAFINDGRWNTRGGDGPGICVRFRVMFDKHRATQRVVVVAVKDIPKGTELLTSYDNDYWRLQKGVHAQRTKK
ncbi:Possible SET domain containing protein, related [Eimeria praecox]|uniref:Possible SET domain containing protein, related n=1 Tax=Eimeria praecox TaxID=51316 RepID=U6H3S7_9EIME|nr:Possible SET domain containing protein, related [Eimeria praecox]